MAVERRRMKRRIMREFSIGEISAVDRPAQTHARVALMKREDSGMADLPGTLAKGYIDPTDGARSFAEVLESELAHERFSRVMREVGPTIYAFESALRSIAADADISTDEKQLRMRNSAEEFLAVMRQRWPDVEEALAKGFAEDGEGTDNQGDEGMSDDVNKQVGDLQKQVTDLTQKLEKVTAASEDAAKVAEVQDQLQKVQEELQEAKTKAEKAEAEKAEAEELSKLTDAEKDYAARQDDAGRRQFMQASPDERKKLMAKAASDDETVEIEGQTIRKSTVGEEQFAVFKAQADRLAKYEKDLSEEREARQMAEFAKRAEDELTHLPGETEAKARVLKAVAGMDEETRGALETMLTAGEKALKAGFDTLGHRDGQRSASAAEFNKRVTEIRARDNCSRTDAMAKAREEYPKEFEAYQASAAGN